MSLPGVGMARCDVRAALSGEIRGANYTLRANCTARWNAGGDIAARCPYLPAGSARGFLTRQLNVAKEKRSAYNSRVNKPPTTKW
jgi:hypothetical protein